MSAVSADEITEAQHRSAHRALDTLDRLDGRLADYYASQRQHVRRRFRTVATVRLGQGHSAREITVWTREISESGMSFICPERISDEWVLVGLQTESNRPVWVVADILRRREIPTEEFWEHGAAFRERVKGLIGPK